jgi:hypothetical protein
MSATATKSKTRGSTKSKAARSTGKGKTKSASAKSKAAAKTSGTSASPKTSANKKGGNRLSPGALDGLVIGYMKRNRAKLPATSGVVGRGIKRSPGAITNCLARLEKAGKVKLTNKKPREYDLATAASKDK